MKLANLKLPKVMHWLIYAAGILVVLSAIVISLAGTGWFRNILQHRIENSLAQITGGKVEIDGMRFRPLSLRVSARRLVIHGLERDSSLPLFSASDVVADISPESLVEFRLLLRKLQWQQASLRIRTYPDGSTNVPGATVSPGQGQGLADLFNLGIKHLNLGHTTLDWNNQRIRFGASARNLAIELHISQMHHYLGTIASSAVVFAWKSGTLPPVSFATSFTLSSNQLQLQALSWQIENLRGHLAGSLRWTPQPAGSFEFRTNGGLQKLARALKSTSLESGYLYIDGKGNYGEKGLSVEGRMQVRELRLKTPRFKPGPISLSADYDLTPGNNMKLSDLVFAGIEGRARGEANVSFARASPRIVLRSRIEKLDLSALLNAFPASAGSIGIIHPHAIISGVVDADWQRPSGLQGQFDLQLLPPAQQPAAGLSLSGHAQGSLVLDRKAVLTIKDAQISTPHSSLAVQGTFGNIRSSLAVKFMTTDFEEWRPVAKILIETKHPLPIKLHSQAVFNGTVSGTLSNPEIDGQISAGNFNYGGWLWDSIQAGILASPQRVRIQSGRLRLGKSSLILNAEATLIHWKLEPHSAVRLQATARETPLAGLRAALDLKPSMEGLLTGQVQAEGTVENLSGRGQITVHKGKFAGLPFASLSANVLASKSAWEASDIELVEGKGHAEGDLEINPVQRTFSANLRGRDFPLGHLHMFIPQKPGAKGNGEVSGLVSFDLDGKGSFDNARVHSTLDVTQLSWKGQSLGSIHGDAEWQGQQISIKVKGGGGQTGNFQARGDMETRNNWPLHLSGQYSDLRADPWIEEFSGHSMAAQVSLSGSFSISGPLMERGQIVGNSQIQQLKINFPSLKLSNAAPVEVSYAKQNLEFTQFRLQGESTNFEVGGSIRFRQPPSLDFTVRGKAAATLLSLLESRVQATGESDVEVRVRGTLAEPDLNGTVEVKDVGLGYPELPFRLNSLNGTIKLQGERAVISSLKGTVGGGTVDLGGFMVLQEGLRYQIHTRLSQVRVRYPADFTSVLDGDLRLAGTAERGQLSGNISVRNIFAPENLSLVDFLTGSSNLLGAPSPNAPSPFASHINLNVRLASLRPVRIETHNLRLVSDIDIRLQGTLANPVAVGNIYLRSGQTVFRGNRYTLTRGDISMSNPFQTEPVLDLQVNTQVDKYDLTLELSGPPDRIKLSYRSDPPLPTEDILSLLAFGYSRRLEEFAPQPTSPLSSASTGLLSQALSSQISGRIQRLFGVSRIKLSPISSEVGTLGGPVLTIEQQLSSKLTLTYQTSTANSLYRVIEFDFTVNPRMSVRGFRDQNGIFGLELKFRKRFK